VAAKTEFEQWIANEYSFVHHNMVTILKPCWEAATKAAEARFTTHNKQSTPCSHVNQHPVNNNLGYCRKCDDCGAYL
jgi:hypothetical protein